MDHKKQDSSDKYVSLLIANQKRILGYILTYVPNYADADDILQNTLSILWKKFDQFDPETDFVAYATKIAKYEIMNYFRKNKNSKKLHFDDKLYEIIEDESASTSHLFNQRKEALKECFKEFSANDKQLIKMRYEQDLSFSKIGQRLLISPAGVFKKMASIHGRLIRCIRLRLAFEETV